MIPMIVPISLTKQLRLSLIILPLVVIFTSFDINNASGITYSNFTSEQYKIKFQYPSDWTVDEKTSRFDEGTSIKLSSPSLGAGDFFIQYANDLLTGFGNTDLKAAVYETLKDAISDYKYKYSIIEKPYFIKIGDKDAGTFVYSWKDKYEDYATLWGTQMWIVFVGENGYLINFMQPASSFDNADSTEIRDRLINSIEFLDKDNTTNTQLSRFG